MIDDCLNCGHPIGYHHAGTAPAMFCTCKDCSCTGYRSEGVDSPLASGLTRRDGA